jgi:hypothetical protein
MEFYPGLIALLGILAAVPALAGIPDSPQQVQPLSVGTRAPIFAARTTEGALSRTVTRSPRPCCSIGAVGARTVMRN